MNMKTYKQYPSWNEQENEWMKDPAFAAKAKEAEPEYQIARMLIAKRLKKGYTQLQLARKIKTSQSAIARVESGTHPASLTFLKKIAHALDAHVHISIQ